MNKHAAAFLRERVAEFYKATFLLSFTFKLTIKIVALIEFRELDNKKALTLQIKYS